MMYSISWHHEPVRVRSHAALLASFSCAICYFGVLLKGWCCYCTCDAHRQGMLCQYRMPKRGLHFKLIFSRLKLIFFVRFLDLSRPSKWHLARCSWPQSYPGTGTLSLLFLFSLLFLAQSCIYHWAELACLMFSFSIFSWLLLAQSLVLFCLFNFPL